MLLRPQAQRLPTLLCLFNCCLLHIMHHTTAGILPLILPKPSETPAALANSDEKLGYIEYIPNGTLILRSTMENGTNLQNLLLFKGILGALQLSPNALQPSSKWNIKIYGEGVEHKFPPFLERIIQRIQSYFSVYKYPDSSRPGAQPVLVQGGAAGTYTNFLTAITQTVTATTPSSTTTPATATNVLAGTTNKLDVSEGGGGSVAGPLYLHANDDDDEYTEFISIGEHDDFITVGED